jgi:hypothetical protein
VSPAAFPTGPSAPSGATHALPRGTTSAEELLVRALARETWKARAANRHAPIGGVQPFTEWRNRIREATEAGYSPNHIRLAAAEAGTTRNMWDRALGIAGRRLHPVHVETFAEAYRRLEGLDDP